MSTVDKEELVQKAKLAEQSERYFMQLIKTFAHRHHHHHPYGD